MWRGGLRPLLLDKEVSGAYGGSCGYSPFADDPVAKWRHRRLRGVIHRDPCNKLRVNSLDRPAVEPQLTAFFTSAPIFTSSVAVNSFSAKATGHPVPSSRFALSLKPDVAYLALETCAHFERSSDVAVLGVRGHPFANA